MKDLFKGCVIFVITILSVIIIFFAIIFGISWYITEANVTLINGTNKEILKGTAKLKYENESYEFSLKPKESKSFIFQHFSDDSYSFDLTFSNHKKIKESLGYVTNGAKYKDTIIVYEENDSIKLNYYYLYKKP